jgi:hypothetical protein
MGNQLTRDNSFPLAQLPVAKFKELTEDSYTVIRTNGEAQEGFRIPRAGHYCKQDDSQRPSWEHAHAWDGLKDSQTIATEQAAGEVNPGPYKKWKVHLVKFSEDPSQNRCDVCGWRTMMPDNGIGAFKNQRSFWPTRLTTPEEKEAWWSEMDALLNSLKRFADLSPEEVAEIRAADAARDEEVNGDLRRAIAAEHEKIENEQRMAHQANAEGVDEKDVYAARHVWWGAFDAEAAELKAAIKAEREAQGLSPEIAAVYAKSVADDIMGAKQREVVAATPSGAPYIWPSGTAVKIWEASAIRARAKVEDEVNLAFPKFSPQQKQDRADYAIKNPDYWAPWSQWLKTTTPEQRLKQEQDSDWALRHG